MDGAFFDAGMNPGKYLQIEHLFGNTNIYKNVTPAI